MFGDEGDAEDAPPDADNPFDFRHFLKSVEEAQQREEPSSQPNRSTLGTPLHKAAISTPVSRPVKSTPATAAAKKRKTPSAAATRPNPKRVRAGEDPPTTKPAKSIPPAFKASAAAVPQVRIDRKASVHQDTAATVEDNSQPDGLRLESFFSALTARGGGPEC